MITVTQAWTSPFVRKVRIVVGVKGLQDRVTFLDPDKDGPENDALRAANPLQKVPAARLDDGTLIYDSHVICEHFDTLSPSPRLFPASGAERLRILTLAALADGIMDAAILIVYEGRFRPEDKWHQGWIDKQQIKVDQALDYLEAHTPEWSGTPDYADISLACALGFLDLRQGGRWRKAHPKMVAWLERFAAAVPSFAATTPPG